MAFCGKLAHGGWRAPKLISLSFVVQFYSPSHLLSRWQLVYLVTACVLLQRLCAETVHRCISVTFGIIDWFCLPANPTAAWWLVSAFSSCTFR